MFRCSASHTFLMPVYKNANEEKNSLLILLPKEISASSLPHSCIPTPECDLVENGTLRTGGCRRCFSVEAERN